MFGTVKWRSNDVVQAITINNLKCNWKHDTGSSDINAREHLDVAAQNSISQSGFYEEQWRKRYVRVVLKIIPRLISSLVILVCLNMYLI